MLLTGGQPQIITARPRPLRSPRSSRSAWRWRSTVRTGTADRRAGETDRRGLPPVTAASLAWVLQPWALVGAGAATTVDANLSTVADWLALTGYCLLATLGLIVMEMYRLWAPTAANARLKSLRSWMDQHQEQLIVTFSLLAGLWLTARRPSPCTAPSPSSIRSRAAWQSWPRPHGRASTRT
ncbi:GAP family protein [Streptomyces sp. NPDC054766]